ncbi:MAG: 2-methylisocitrate lyase-like PEP mutase family enzyme [Candidatus Latescibacterota bacterium]|jgi:2-methylisocitrate lyase-like PEP mutase family enzyme
MSAQWERAEQFAKLHEGAGIFVLPNPWDAGSAKMLMQLGFAALATTSAGFAFALGRPDAEGALQREEALENVRAIVEATPLPVSADLENGFGDEPDTCAETIRLAAAAGLVGASIEDATGRQDEPIYAKSLAVERVAAAVEMARSLPFPFVLTARADNLIRGRNDIEDTIERLQAYALAGADVLYAPGLKSKEEMVAVVAAVAPQPVNVIMGISGAHFSLAELEEIGVKRVSVGSALARAAYGAFWQGAREIRERGTFQFSEQAIPFGEINAIMKDRGGTNAHRC